MPGFPRDNIPEFASPDLLRTVHDKAASWLLKHGECIVDRGDVPAIGFNEPNHPLTQFVATVEQARLRDSVPQAVEDLGLVGDLVLAYAIPRTTIFEDDPVPIIVSQSQFNIPKPEHSVLDVETLFIIEAGDGRVATDRLAELKDEFRTPKEGWTIGDLGDLVENHTTAHILGADKITRPEAQALDQILDVLNRQGRQT